MSVWFVTGASRGLGAEIARAALAAGHEVVATARDRTAIPAASLALALDVTDEGQASARGGAAGARVGRVDRVGGGVIKKITGRPHMGCL
ncbi:SDR family NAD(P)-dependent oxidoreductase [Umezawaea sp. NPDC059074]|uniref:SDR family NAD(P)-dependent oxidoreductase n=1 Tax=Umezawaea sp. NPDC059074 TaxID=3346716 RepID=UPI0036A7F3A2